MVKYPVCPIDRQVIATGPYTIDRYPDRVVVYEGETQALDLARGTEAYNRLVAGLQNNFGNEKSVIDDAVKRYRNKNLTKPADRRGRKK